MVVVSDLVVDDLFVDFWLWAVLAGFETAGEGNVGERAVDVVHLCSLAALGEAKAAAGNCPGDFDVGNCPVDFDVADNNDDDFGVGGGGDGVHADDVHSFVCDDAAGDDDDVPGSLGTDYNPRIEEPHSRKGVEYYGNDGLR